MTAPEEPGQALADVPGARPVVGRRVLHRGMKWDLVSDKVQLDDETAVEREVVVHPGAVGVVALDGEGRVLLLRQYRHPVEGELWELPAGLLDEPGENALAAAERELYEEAHLTAARWHTLADVFSSPGMSSEAYRIYLARDLAVVPETERHVAEAEERAMPVQWVPLATACAWAVAGRLHNAMAVLGVLSAREALGSGALRPAQAPWTGVRPPGTGPLSGG